MLSLSVPQTIFTCEGQWILSFVTHLLLALFFFVFVIGDIFLCCISFIKKEDKLKIHVFYALARIDWMRFSNKQKIIYMKSFCLEDMLDLCTVNVYLFVNYRMRSFVVHHQCFYSSMFINCAKLT